MQENILSTTSFKKLYSQKGIFIGSIFGGPIITGYLLAKNYSSLELQEKKKQSWLICTGAFVLLTLLAFVLPPRVPSALFIFAYSSFGHYITLHLQGKLLEEHRENGGSFYSNWRSAGIALLFTLILIAVFLAVYFISDLSMGKM